MSASVPSPTATLRVPDSLHFLYSPSLAAYDLRCCVACPKPINFHCHPLNTSIGTVSSIIINTVLITIQKGGRYFNQDNVFKMP